MKKINFDKLAEMWPTGLVLFVFSIVVLAFAWWEVSHWSLNLFTKICDSNGGSGCMVFYWKQVNYYWIVLKIFFWLSLILGIGTSVLIIKKKNGKGKKNKK